MTLMGSKSTNTDEFDLQHSISETYHTLVAKLVDSLPDVIGALVLILIGLLVAYGAKVLVRRLIAGLDTVLQSLFRTDSTQSGFSLPYSSIISRVAFWIVLLFFVAAAANLMGWSIFSGWMEKVATYVPGIITGVLIIFGGIFLGRAAKSFATHAAATARLEQPMMIGRITQMVVVFTMVVIGVEQLGVNTHFLTNVLNVVIGVMLAGGALAFGLGAKRLVANVIGVQCSRKFCRVGQEVSIDGIEGVVVEITQTAIVLETETGQAVVPASLFNEQISKFSESSTTTSPSSSVAKTEDEGKDGR